MLNETVTINQQHTQANLEISKIIGINIKLYKILFFFFYFVYPIFMKDRI